MDSKNKGQDITQHGFKPVSKGLKPSTGSKSPKPPKGGSSQSPKGK